MHWVELLHNIIAILSSCSHNEDNAKAIMLMNILMLTTTSWPDLCHHIFAVLSSCSAQQWIKAELDTGYTAG